MISTKITELISRAFAYINYTLTAKHRKGHGIHSPYVYDLVANVFYNYYPYKEYAGIAEIRKHLRNSTIEIKVENLGAVSKRFNKERRRVSELTKISSVNKKFGQLLFRLVKFYRPNYILELGTSVGIGTIYLASGFADTKVISIEGNKELCSFARNLFKYNGFKNIEVINGMFDDLLPGLITEIPNHSLIFIDGNHSYMPTISYYEQICNFLEDCIIIFDDINWSIEMQKAWKEICNNPKSQVSIDLFSMGIVIRDNNITPGNYKVRY